MISALTDEPIVIDHEHVQFAHSEGDSRKTSRNDMIAMFNLLIAEGSIPSGPSNSIKI